MGACSSKPKTTEFEGSTEPSKDKDRSVDAVDVPPLSQQNESGKEEAAGNAAVHETHEVIAGGEPLTQGVPSTAEGVSGRDQPEAGADDDDAGNSAAKKNETAAGVQDVGVGVDAAGIQKVSNKSTTVDEGVGVDLDKQFEDKAVVLDEAGIGGVGRGNDYIDKKVAADEEKARDSGRITTQEGQQRNLQDMNDFPGVDSPIIGVILPADPPHVDDVSESVGSATAEDPAHADSPVKVEGGGSRGTNIGGDGVALTEEAADTLSSPTEGATEENTELVRGNSKGSPLLGSDDGVGQKRGANDAGKEVPLASADVQDEFSVEGRNKSERIEDERTSEPQESTRETAEAADEREVEAPKVDETVDAGTSTEPLAEARVEKAMGGQNEASADEINVDDVQTLASATEELAKDGKPEVAPDDGVAKLSAETEREEKLEEPHAEEGATIEEKEENVDAGNHDFLAEQQKNAPGEADSAFEDASDVPLKVESSTNESGDTPRL